MDSKDEKKTTTNKKRKRISKKELLRRKQRRKKIMILAAVAAAVVLAIAFIPQIVSMLGESADAESEDGIVLEEVDISEVRHLAFDMLSIESSETRMSAEGFSEALTDLYMQGYVLIDVYDIVDISEEGELSYKDTVSVPKGKKPLILTQTDISYPMDAAGEGVADKLVLEGGKLKAQYTNASGQARTGDYDFVSVLESFIGRYPDFSYDGARAVLCASGETGVFGYRTASYFSGTENNPYADYGTFDTASEKEAASEIVEELKELGYRFACCGFEDDISYGAEYSIVKADVEKWLKETEPVVGETDLIYLPRQTDIGSWSGYTEDNSKYGLLSESGFKFYFVGNNATPSLLQVKDGYVRQTVYEVHTDMDFDNTAAWM